MAVSILVAFALAAAQVILRYVFNTGIIWIEPVVVNLTLLGAMMGAARAVGLRTHVRVGILADSLPPRIGRLFHLAAWLASLGYCVFILYASVLFVQFLIDSGVVAVETGLPSWVEFMTTPIAMGFFILRYLLILPGVWRGDLAGDAVMID